MLTERSNSKLLNQWLWVSSSLFSSEGSFVVWYVGLSKKSQSPRAFNIEKTSKRMHGFPVVWPEEQSQPRRNISSWPPKGEWRSWPHSEFIWDGRQSTLSQLSAWIDFAEIGTSTKLWRGTETLVPSQRDTLRQLKEEGSRRQEYITRYLYKK